MQQDELKAECLRQVESCLYTSTSLYVWLRWARIWRKIFVITPIVFGAVAGWSVLDDAANELVRWVTAGCALLAGTFPAIFLALDLNMHIDEISRAAAEFKTLQDRFRQLAHIKSLSPFEDFESAFGVLMERMEVARASSITPPEWCFRKAQKKITSGDYDFELNRSPKHAAHRPSSNG